MIIRITPYGETTQDITQLVSTVQISGELKRCARVANITFLNSPYDDSQPKIKYKAQYLNGALAEIIIDNEVTFYGYVIDFSQSTTGHIANIKCYDRGFYLNKNEFVGRCNNETPESFAKRVCREYSIPVGNLAATGIPQTRLFLTGGNTAYQVIATMYTLVSQKNGKKYQIGFKADKLEVWEKKPSAKTLIIQGGSNLINLSSTASLENLVTTVKIYDSNHKLVKTIDDAQRRKQFGQVVKTLIQSKENNQQDKAQELLKDGDIQQKITVDNFGNKECITGKAVIVHEIHTNTFGLFYIDGDIHEWKKNQYYNKLTLNFKKLMDEQEVGSLEKEKKNAK